MNILKAENKDSEIKDTKEIPIISRRKWKAEEPKEAETTKNFPLPYLVLMQTNTPVCKTKKDCKKVVRDLQKKHMEEGAPDIHYNYLISIDGTVFEGRSPKMAGMTYNADDEKLSKAENNSINIAYIDNGKENISGEKLHSAVTKLVEKLIKENIINADSDIVWFDQRKKKKKRLSLSERMDKYRLINKVQPKSSDPSTEQKVLKRKRKKTSKDITDDVMDVVKRENIQGPFILEPHHFGILIDRKDELGREGEEEIRFF